MSLERVKNTAKRVAASIAMEAVLDAVRGYINELLKPVKPGDLYRAIKEDADPWDYANTEVKTRGRFWAEKLRKYKDRVNAKLVLEWMKKDRPDLASVVINSQGGVRWLARRTEQIKNRLWPPQPKLNLIEQGETAEEQEEQEQEEKPEEEEVPVRYG